MQLRDYSDAPIAIAWINDAGGYAGPTKDNILGEIAIKTLEGVMHARLGDWIIRGVEGEFYPCKPGIFDATYEAVDA